MAYGSSYGMASRNIVLCLLLPAFLCSSFGGTMPQLEVEPEFLAPLENHTVTQGRDVSFTCVVNHLESYKVAWIKSDSRAILAIHTHMVAHNTRLSVTHNGHNTWKLHVTNVQPSDSGTYMCQVNTDPMRSQMGYMKVVIPPDIMDLDDSADRLTTEEGGELLLRCRATGTPKPGIIWRREDGGNIILRDEHGVKQEKSYEGEQLRLTGVQRQQMGSYLCIATNGVPPTVSKRYSVHVHFKPLIKVVNQLVAAPLGSDVVLQCYVESSPKAMNTWYKDDGIKLLSKEKYEMSEISITDYSYQLNLTIRRLSASDFGSYTCSSENAFGRAEGTVRLQELRIMKVTAPTIRPTLQILKGESKDKPAAEEKSKKDSSTWEGAKTDNDLDGKKLSASGATPMVRGHSSKDSWSSGNLKLPAHHPAPSSGPVHSTPAEEVTESAAPWKQSTMSGATLTIAFLALMSCI